MSVLAESEPFNFVYRRAHHSSNWQTEKPGRRTVQKPKSLLREFLDPSPPQQPTLARNYSYTSLKKDRGQRHTMFNNSVQELLLNPQGGGQTQHSTNVSDFNVTPQRDLGASRFSALGSSSSLSNLLETSQRLTTT